MYQIKEEQGKFVVYCGGKEIARFGSEKEAEGFLRKETEYPIPKEGENTCSIID